MYKVKKIMMQRKIKIKSEKYKKNGDTEKK